MAIAANSFRCLQQVLKLVEISIRIRVISPIDSGTETHPIQALIFIKLQVVGAFVHYKIIGLVGVVKPVKLFNGVSCRIIIITIFFRLSFL